MEKILVTGGCGYIGSHTLVDLIENGYDVISVDNFSRSRPSMLEGVEKITGRKIKNYYTDLCLFGETQKIFRENPDIKGIIHFAAYKSVNESVENPLLYFENNLVSLINLLKCATQLHVPHFVFSSSCSVYGNPDRTPVTEDSPLAAAESPYGATKQMGEEIVRSCSHRDKIKSCLLRYFNPVGAHPSGLIGEYPIGKPSNLVPVITQTAAGIQESMEVYGTDYSTRDGSCIRDYIHVCDIAHAHTLALEYLKSHPGNCEVFNLGSGSGHSVLELIEKFQSISGMRLNYSVGPRRAGDVIAIFADNKKARDLLGWKLKYGLEDMMRSAWNWQLQLLKEKG